MIKINYMPIRISPKNAIGKLPFKIDNYNIIEEISDKNQNKIDKFLKHDNIKSDRFDSKPTIAIKFLPVSETESDNFGDFRYKAIFLSLFLSQPIWFATNNSYFCYISGNSIKRIYGVSYQTPAIAYWIDDTNAKKINLKEVSFFYNVLKEYFCFENKLIDPLYIAAQSLWNSLITKDWSLAFISRTMILESLLSQENIEISHQIAERTTFLLKKVVKKSRNLYHEVKDLYGIRSNIVHCNLKKGLVPAFQKDSRENIYKITHISRLVLKHTILNKDLLNKIKDKDRNNLLRDYFLNLQFGEKT